MKTEVPKIPSLYTALMNLPIIRTIGKRRENSPLNTITCFLNVNVNTTTAKFPSPKLHHKYDQNMANCVHFVHSFDGSFFVQSAYFSISRLLSQSESDHPIRCSCYCIPIVLLNKV